MVHSVRPHRLKFTERIGEKVRVFVDVSRTHAMTRTTGIERVTTEVSKALALYLHAEPAVEVVFFKVTPLGRLAAVEGRWWEPAGKSCKSRKVPRIGPRDVILLLDLSLPPIGLNRREISLLSNHGVKVFSFVYDVIPLTHPQFFKQGKKFTFEAWFRGVSAGYGLVYISRFTRDEARRQAAALNLESPKAELVLSMGPLTTLSVGRQTSPGARSVKQTGLRCVAIGTIEPRKDYGFLLDAFEFLWITRSDVSLTVIGRRGWNATDTVERLERLQYTQPLFSWIDNADDDELINALSHSDVLISTSVVEGFGLPLLEANAIGLQVLARDIQVFRECFPFAVFFDGSHPKHLAQKLVTIQEKPSQLSDTSKQIPALWSTTAEQLSQFLLSE